MRNKRHELCSVRTRGVEQVFKIFRHIEKDKRLEFAGRGQNGRSRMQVNTLASPLIAKYMTSFELRFPYDLPRRHRMQDTIPT